MPHMLSATPEISQDPIGPCGPLEQSEDSLRHSTIATWSSTLSSGAHPVVGRYYSGYTLAARMIVRMMRVSIRFRLRIGVLSKRFCGIGISLTSGSVISDIVL